MERDAGLPLTVNAVMHRQNLHQLSDIIEMAVDLGASPARGRQRPVLRLGAEEPRRADADRRAARRDDPELVEEARERLRGTIVIDYVIPDYYAQRPKKCMGGWGRQFFNISPSGKILPCHAAESITGLEFDSVRGNKSIAWIWQNSDAFQKYRGTGWMPEPCQELRFPRDRLGRLPLPGLRADRRRRQHRPGLHALAAARGDLQAGRRRRPRPTEPLHLPQFRRRHAGDRRRAWRLTPTPANHPIAPIRLRR